MVFKWGRASYEPEGDAARAPGRGVRAGALGAAFGLGVAAGFAYEGVRDGPPVPRARAADGADVVATLTGRTGPTGGALPGLDAIVTRLDPASGARWSRVCSGGGAMSQPAVAVAPSGEVALAITFQGSIDCGAGAVAASGGPDDFDAVVVALDASGNVAWTRSVSDVGPQALAAVAFDPWGSVVVAGSFAGTIDLGGPPLTARSDLDIFAARLDAGGDLVWQRRFGLRDRNYGVDVAVASNGRVFLLARGAADIDFGPGVLTAGAITTFVAELDARGATLWSRAFAGSGDVLGTRLLPLEDGGAVVVGRFEGTANLGAGDVTSRGAGTLFFVRLTASGDPSWSASHVWASPLGAAGVLFR